MSITLTTPGVYIQEIDIAEKGIIGVSTSTAGFLGETERGKTEPQLVTGFGDYLRKYGGYAWKTGDKLDVSSKSFLPYAVQGFFANGGQSCFIGRIVGKKSAAAAGTLSGEKVSFTITAIGAGTWGNRIGISVHEASTAGKDETIKNVFKLKVFYWSGTPPAAGAITDPPDLQKLKDGNDNMPAQEEFDNLSWDPTDSNYVLSRLHRQSHLIEISEAAPATPTPPPAPAPAGATPQDKLVFLTKGSDGTPVTSADYDGDSDDDQPTGFAGFEAKEDISIVCVPNSADDALYDDLNDKIVAHCEKMKDRFGILQAKWDEADIGDLYPAGSKVDSKYTAFYYPWIKIHDPVTNILKPIPPGGHIAGIFAGTDNTRGVHKAPANERVSGALDLQFNVTDGEQGILNPRGVNCIRFFQGRGILLWGARTTSDDPDWIYVNVRRLFIYLEKSLKHSTQWVVFEPNNEALWARLAQGVSDWLTTVWRSGALMGKTAEEAFFVKCDRTTMTQNDIDNGRLIMLIGVAPTKPAEFVVFQLAQWNGGSSITE